MTAPDDPLKRLSNQVFTFLSKTVTLHMLIMEDC
jgi:hypothetical protein